jgi:hypothetical protein
VDDNHDPLQIRRMEDESIHYIDRRYTPTVAAVRKSAKSVP